MSYSVLVCFLLERNMKESKIQKIDIYFYTEGLEEFKGRRSYSKLSNAQTHFSTEKQPLKKSKPRI